MKITIAILLIHLSTLFCQNYYVENAFPNLNFSDPVGIYHSDDETNRLFILEQEGIIKVVNNNSNELNATIFLDITSIVNQDPGYTEEGLLGLAFHPNFEENGYFYVNYTDYNPKRNVIKRYTVSSDNPNYANPQSGLIILNVEQPYTNHNGGQMGFGPDGYLYISFGDGGSAGDPLEHGQNLQTLLGSIIRIDVNNTINSNYSIPSDNPFISNPNALDEIYAYGLRNMWRFSWDSATQLLWGADVGQYGWEEINIIKPGLNYGWNEMEGNHCYPEMSNCEPEGLEPPIYEYPLYVDGVCSITGGYVYRGNLSPSLYGKYIYGDWCTGDIWSLKHQTNSNTTNEKIITTNLNITTFGLDQNNEILFAANSNIYRLLSDEQLFEIGDINKDEQINIQDIILIINFVLGNQIDQYEFWSSDLNKDNLIDILDVVLIINLILNN